MYKGIAGSEGIGIGTVVLIEQHEPDRLPYNSSSGCSGGGRRQPCAQSASSPEPDNPARILRIPDSAKGPAWDRAQNAGAALPAGKESAVSDLSSFPAV